MKPDEENMDVEARRLTQPQGGGAKSRRAARHRTNETETMNGADVNTELLNRGDAMPVITSRPVNRRNRRTSPRSQLVEDGARDRINTHTNSDRESSSNSCSSGAGGGTPRGRQLDTLLKNSDDRGAYKRFLILWWLVPVCLVVPCAYLNVLLMVQVPLSNCTVPPPPGHLSTYHWRLLVTPKTQTGELNPCALYDFSSALSDPQYDPGTSRQYSTRTYNTTYDDQIGPSTPQPRLSTPWEDTGGLKTPPGTVDRESDDTEGFTSIPVDSYTLGTNTGPVEAVTTSEVPGITKGTAEEHPSTPGQQGEALEQHLSTQNQHSTTTDGSSTIDHQGSTRKHHFSTHKGGLSTPNQQISTRTQHSTTRQHHSTTEHTTRHKLTNTHTQTVSSKESDPTQPGLVKSRVARHFDPFNDLYVSGRKKEGGEGGAKQDDPMEKYLKAAVKWQKEYPGVAPPMVYTMGCVFGHDFDKTYVEKSLATELGWACEEAGNSTRMLYVCVAGAVIGSLLFGILADRVGRKWVLMLLAVKAAALGSLFVLVKSSLTLLILRFFISLGLPAIYNVVVITALEQVRDEERGMVTCLASVCFSLGQCVLGFLGWLLGSWVTLGLVTSLPCVLALAYSRLLEESPQWLVARGRGKEAALVLRRITMRNHPRNPLAPSLLLLQTRIKKIRGGEAEQFEQAGMCQGVCSLLIGVGEFLASYPRLCFRMVLLTVCWTVNFIIYLTTTWKSPSPSDNPYLVWFLSAVTEVPANLLLPLFLGYLGRRSLHSAGLAVCTSIFFIAAGLLGSGYEESCIGIAVLVVVARVFVCVTYLVVSLQATELHPTLIRSSFTGLACLVALTASAFSPAILTVEPLHAYLLLGLLALTGMLSAALLPETAGRPLPQTLQEAEELTWAGLKPSPPDSEVEEIREVLTSRPPPLPPPLPPPPSLLLRGISSLDTVSEESVL